MVYCFFSAPYSQKTANEQSSYCDTIDNFCLKYNTSEYVSQQLYSCMVYAIPKTYDEDDEFRFSGASTHEATLRQNEIINLLIS